MEKGLHTILIVFESDSLDKTATVGEALIHRIYIQGGQYGGA